LGAHDANVRSIRTRVDAQPDRHHAPLWSCCYPAPCGNSLQFRLRPDQHPMSRSIHRQAHVTRVAIVMCYAALRVNVACPRLERRRCIRGNSLGRVRHTIAAAAQRNCAMPGRTAGRPQRSKAHLTATPRGWCGVHGVLATEASRDDEHFGWTCSVVALAPWPLLRLLGTAQD
jgi:hypothetical protein